MGNIIESSSGCSGRRATVIVRNGSYPRLTISRKFTKPVVFRAENDYQARLKSADVVILTYYATNIEFSGFDISRSSSSNPLAIHIAGGSNITLCNNIIHESYNNDLLKINEGARNIMIIGNVFRNQQGTAGQHIDVNGCTDVLIRENIFFNDGSAAGVNVSDTHGFVVVKNSGRLAESRRTSVTGNIFLNFQGGAGSNFVLAGEDGYTIHEAQEIVVENNLLIGNSSVPMRAPFGVKGGRDIVFRNNTITGDLPGNAFGMRLNREGSNPYNQNIVFGNNIWSDPAGTMGDFSDGTPTESVDVVLRNNLYWNGGQPIPADPDILNFSNDIQGLQGNPLLPSPTGITLPNWQGTRFASGSATIRQEFERLARGYAKLGAGSPALARSNPTEAPEHDILDAVRDASADLGAMEAAGVAPSPRLVLLRNRVMGGTTLKLNRIFLRDKTGGTVLLSSSNSTLASVPASIVVPAGDNSVQFEIATSAVSSPTPVTIQLSHSGATHTATLLVVPQGVVSVNPNNYWPKTGESTHSLMMEGPANQALTIQMSSSRPDLVSFPNPVVVAAEAAYASFTVNCKPVPEWAKITITASYGSSSRSTVFTFEPTTGEPPSTPTVAISSLTLSKSTVAGATTVQGTVTMSGPAPSGGSVLSISANPGSVVSLPAAVTVPAGGTTASFQIQTTTVSTTTSVGITAASSGSTKTATLAVNPPTTSPAPQPGSLVAPTGLYPPASASGGTQPGIVVTLSAAAPTGGTTLQLGTSRADLVSLPATLLVPAGQTRFLFYPSLKLVPANVLVTISVTGANVTRTSTLTILPVAVTNIYPSAVQIKGGSSTSGNLVTLNYPAAQGTAVALSSSHAALKVPSSMPVAAGSTRGTFTITTSPVSSTTNVTITASSGGVKRTTTITVVP